VKIRSLAEEAKIIRYEERKAGGTGPLYEDLRGHRVRDVRQEQRSSLIDYAYLRGMPYHRVENPAPHNPPNWDRVRKIAQKFSAKPLIILMPDTLKDWAEFNPVAA
jgi:hypothetical protein